ncbi:uncharacterized protein LACBIDRAFT_295385 [Laccaria bicolor S238N-H82]|uniref:Predicted protein n=1 Tax=Laccaria bicolor (strain S238N-H82 / ATCC MYA-4686) TaxID=486041 RepID=B0DRP5_LACBS|nr:uncharacterized protein LACBIDRAFT_295385 [Laccaria bicolor S238N-H82]EDR02824.1 predicted protein [Laccaria bicolor S238N-H82]|eukprot:XP_001886534.1 predicted protein [Laccaria bicolor S238N-H82]
MSSIFTSPPRIPPPPIPGKSPARNALPTASRNPTTALTPTPPKRKPSLASPSPPTPLIPSFNAATSRQPTTPVPPQSQSQIQNQSQYVTIFQRPTCATSSPDSPTSRAMMKRLLAKPAAPALYSGSESEGRSVGVMKRAATVDGKGSVKRSEDRAERRVNEEKRRAATMTSEQRIRMTGNGSDNDGRGTSGRRIQEMPLNERRTFGKPEEKQRKLLRRKPSSSRVTSPSSSPSRAVGSSNTNTTIKRSASAAALTVSSTHSRAPSPKPPSITPASALVQAYRAQEQSERGHVADPSSPSTPYAFSSSDPKHLHDDDPATPYYTVFGSSSDRVVPADSFEARAAGWSSEGYFQLEGVKRSATVKSTSSAGGGLKTLTRKVSGRWKKAQQYAGEEEKERGRIRPRPSLQNPGLRKSETRTRTRSLEVEEIVLDGVVKHPPPVKKVNDEERGRRHARRPSSAENPPPVPSEGGGSGNKLWRLMKRISTGGLRDKYRAEQQEPPPLPLPLPGSAFTSPSPLVLEAGKKRALARWLPSASSSRSSSVGGDSTRSRVPTASALKTSGSPSHQQQAQAQAQGSGTTRSSSPVSSSDKSVQYPHSSTSSFGVVDVQPEQPVPPVPSLVNTLRKNSRKQQQQQSVNGVGKYIVHPSQLYKDIPPTPPPSAKGQSNHLSFRQLARPRTADSEDWMIVQSPSVELPSLPFPPRRGTTTLVVSSPNKVVSSAPAQRDSSAPALARDDTERTSGNGGGGRESPLLPEFSISGAINTFRPRKSGDRVALKPPPLFVPQAGSSTSPGRSPSSPMRSASSPTPRSPTSPKSPSHHTRKSESHSNAQRRSEGGLSILTIRPGRRRSSSYDLSTTEPFKSEGSKADRMGSLNPSPATATTSPISSKKSPASKTKSPTTRASTTSRPPSLYTPSRHHTLTEQEKAQRWDDLLEKSARAGGTLHLAGDWDVRLQSDLLRYSSTPSEVEMAGVGVLG